GLAEVLAESEAHSARSRAYIAWCEHNLGAALIVADRPGAAEPHLRRSADLRTSLVRERPDDDGVRVELAGTLANLGLVQRNDRPELADATYAESARALESIVAAKPGDIEALCPFAELLHNWGNLAAKRGDPELALGRYAKGLALVEPVCRSR